MLFDGHLRADLDPEQLVPVLVTDLDETEAGQVMATLDPLAAMAKPNKDAVEALTKQLAKDTDDAFRSLLESMHHVDLTPEGQTDPDDTPPEPPEEPVTKRGDVWLLGRHRLMCGDSQDKTDVEKLLAGARPRLMVTDPPYGVDYDASWRDRAFADGQLDSDVVRSFGNASGSTRRTGRVPGDNSSDWSRTLAVYAPDVLYVWSPPGDQTLVFGAIIEDADFEIRSQLIWTKSRPVISRGHYSYQHEPCWYAVRRGAKADWLGPSLESTVWSIHWDKNVEGGHSTQKPLECMERPIRNHEGDVYDPFVGSGTTIIAAERQARTCYALELEPRYVDVCVNRWEKYTGGKATKEQ